MSGTFRQGRAFEDRRPLRGLLAKVSTAAALSAGLVMGAASPQAAAQAYPSKPVRILVSSGGSETVGRLLATKLGEAWGQGVIADIRSGASGLITLEALARSAPDGYTTAMVTLSQMLSTLEHKRHMLASEYEAVSFVGSTPFVIALNASVPVKNLEEWIAYAKSQPGKLAYASSGMWASAHVCMEEFNARTGVDMLHVPFKTSTAGLQAVVAGQVQAYCSAAANAVSLAAGGKLKLVGSTYKEPSDLVPGVPPIATRLPGFEILGWYGVVAPQRTPKDVVAKISGDSAKVIKTTDLSQQLLKLGIQPEGWTPERFSSFLKAETERWGRIFQTSGAKQ